MYKKLILKSIKDIFDNYQAIGRAVVIPALILIVLNYVSTSFTSDTQMLTLPSIFFIFLSVLVDIVIFVTVVVFPVLFSVVFGGLYTFLIRVISSSLSVDLSFLLVLLNVIISVFLVSALSNTYMYISHTLSNQFRNDDNESDTMS